MLVRELLLTITCPGDVYSNATLLLRTKCLVKFLAPQVLEEEDGGYLPCSASALEFDLN